MDQQLQYMLVVSAFFTAVALNVMAQLFAASGEIYTDPDERILPPIFVRYASGMTVNFLVVVYLMSLDLFNRHFEPRFLPALIYLFCGLFTLWIVRKFWETFCALTIPISWVLLLVLVSSFIRDGVFMGKAHPGIQPWFHEVARSVNTPRDILYLYGYSFFIVGLFSSALVFYIFLKKTVQLARSGRLKFWSQ